MFLKPFAIPIYGDQFPNYQPFLKFAALPRKNKIFGSR